MGELSRGGMTRGDSRACDHDMEYFGKHTPCGILDEDTGQLHMELPVQLLYFPPYHSKYNPIERCWGILELHWNGAKLLDTQTMLAWARSMTWKGLHPIGELSDTIYEKGISLGKKAMSEIENRLQRNPALPKWDILARPA